MTAPTEAIGRAMPWPPFQHGQGLVEVVPRTVGKDYRDAAKIAQGTLGQAVLYPNDRTRSIYVASATAAGVERPAVTSVDQVLAWPLWGKTKGVVLLANYTGEPQPRVEVTFSSPIRVNKLRSIRKGELKFTGDGRHIKAAIPIEGATDILVVEVTTKAFAWGAGRHRAGPKVTWLNQRA